MTDQADRPPRDDRNWAPAVKTAWDEMHALNPSEPDLELLAAYAEGRLTDSERTAYEESLSKSPAALRIWDEVRSHLDAPPELRPAVELRPRRFQLQWLMQAACVLVGVAGVTWGVLASRVSQRQQQQLADFRDRWAKTQWQLGLVHKEQFLAQSPSPVRSFWSGTTSPQLLAMVVLRGTGEQTPESLAEAEHSRQALVELENVPQYAEQATLELINLDIAAGRFETADEKLRQARKRFADFPDFDNVQALWYLAQRNDSSLAEAERRLRSLTEAHPDFLPAWYNLALLLQQSFRDAESRNVWLEYLKREQRSEYREAAQRRMSALGG